MEISVKGSIKDYIVNLTRGSPFMLNMHSKSSWNQARLNPHMRGTISMTFDSWMCVASERERQWTAYFLQTSKDYCLVRQHRQQIIWQKDAKMWLINVLVITAQTRKTHPIYLKNKLRTEFRVDNFLGGWDVHLLIPLLELECQFGCSVHPLILTPEKHEKQSNASMVSKPWAWCGQEW